jgi:hypothetical protein
LTQISPSSDIETNIRRLEKAQDEINAALANFRSVKAHNGGDMNKSLLEIKGPPPPPPPRPDAVIMSFVAKRKELFESQRRRGPLTHSRTLPDSEAFSLDHTGAAETEAQNGRIRHILKNIYPGRVARWFIFKPKFPMVLQ